jgi:arsenite methyltransferase
MKCRWERSGFPLQESAGRTAALQFMILLAAGMATSGQVAHQHHPPRSATEYASALDDPSRDIWQKPAEVVEALRLTGREVVADLGAGTGYFSRRLARVAARVLAVDIDPELLRRIEDHPQPGLETVLTTPDSPGLPALSVDVVFLCNVWHHIENRESYLEKLAATLKPGGRIIVIEFHERQLPVGPPPSMKLSRSQILEEFSTAGFKLAAEHDFLPYQYFLEFSRP